MVLRGGHSSVLSVCMCMRLCMYALVHVCVCVRVRRERVPGAGQKLSVCSFRAFCSCVRETYMSVYVYDRLIRNPELHCWWIRPKGVYVEGRALDQRGRQMADGVIVGNVFETPELMEDARRLVVQVDQDFL